MRNAAQHSRVSRAALWFGLLGGAIAWTFHLILAYVAAEFGCVGQFAQRDYLGITRVAWLEMALTAATTVAAGAATVVAYQIYRRLRSGEADDDIRVAAERETSWAGLLTSGTFTFVILFESIPILYYLQCC